VSGWQEEFGALSSADQYKIREMATIFGVPVSAAYHRSKEFGLLPQRSADASRERAVFNVEPVAITSAKGTPSDRSLVNDALESFLKMWASTDDLIESELKSRGEKFVPGNDDFDALTSIIEENRLERDEYERAISEKIAGSTGPMVAATEKDDGDGQTIRPQGRQRKRRDRNGRATERRLGDG
jgi:hypothetical protein